LLLGFGVCYNQFHVSLFDLWLNLPFGDYHATSERPEKQRQFIKRNCNATKNRTRSESCAFKRGKNCAATEPHTTNKRARASQTRAASGTAPTCPSF
jgi:hypothetical protein